MEQTVQQKRIAVLLSSPVSDEQKERISRGDAPRHDILTLAKELNAMLIEPGRASWGKRGSTARIKQMFSMGWAAFRRRKEYDVIVIDLDAIGAVLALLFKLTRTRRQQVLICHGKLSRGWPGRFTRWLRIHKQVDRFVCYGPAVGERFKTHIKIPAEKISLVKHPADPEFWKPKDVQSERLISSAGMTFRDYVTLAEAVRGMDVRAQFAAFSPWVNPHMAAPDTDLPDNVTFTRLPPNELRDLYARSLFVVVPLRETRSQAGSLVIYESMAMGKAVVAASTMGEKALGLIKEGETGLFYKPGDADDLREKIQYLLDHPEEAARMGKNARKLVEDGLNLDQWLSDMVQIVNEVSGATATEPAELPAAANQ